MRNAVEDVVNVFFSGNSKEVVLAGQPFLFVVLMAFSWNRQIQEAKVKIA
jgi:hypothetical protein